jgi:hypothetical protein
VVVIPDQGTPRRGPHQVTAAPAAMARCTLTSTAWCRSSWAAAG